MSVSCKYVLFYLLIAMWSQQPLISLGYILDKIMSRPCLTRVNRLRKKVFEQTLSQHSTSCQKRLIYSLKFHFQNMLKLLDYLIFNSFSDVMGRLSVSKIVYYYWAPKQLYQYIWKYNQWISPIPDLCL